MSLKSHIIRALKARGGVPAPWSGWNGYTAYTAKFRVERDEHGQLRPSTYDNAKLYIGDNGTVKLGLNFNTSQRLSAAKVNLLIQEGAKLESVANPS